MSRPVYLDVSKIDPNPYQTRLTYSEESMHELRRSIEQLGILTPLLLRPMKDRFQLVCGSRRLKAAQDLGLQEVPAIIKELSDKEMMEITITENLQREDLNPIEEAFGFKRLLSEFEYTHEKLAERLGKSRSYITNSLRLLNLSPTVIGDVLRKTYSPWHARCLLPIKDPKVQFHFANLIWDWNWSVRETRDNVKRYLEAEEYLVWNRTIPIDAISTHLAEKMKEVIGPLSSYEMVELVESIKAQGLIYPITVTVIGTLLDGNSRLSVCKKLGWKTIPAEIFYFCSWLTAESIPNDPSSPDHVPPKGNPILDAIEQMEIGHVKL